MDLVRGTRQDLDLVISGVDDPWRKLGHQKMRMPLPKMSKTDAVHESTSIHSPVWDTKF